MPISFFCQAMWLIRESALMPRTWAFKAANLALIESSSGNWAAQVGVQSRG